MEESPRKMLLEELRCSLAQMENIKLASEKTVRTMGRGFYPASVAADVQPLIDFNKRQVKGAKAEIEALQGRIASLENELKQEVKSVPSDVK